MILLDTNVLSELMRSTPAKPVVDWVAGQTLEDLFTAAPCQAEILAGIAILPRGRRRNELATIAEGMFADDFADRILPFDTEAADSYVELFAVRKQTGHPTALIDLMIAAIALSQGASLATRNTADFSGCGVAVINPWQQA